MSQLGLYSIVGLVVAGAVTRFVLPALLPAGFRIRDVSPAGRSLARAIHVARRARFAVWAVALAGAALLLLHHDRLWDPELASLNPISQRDRAIDGELRAAIGASDARLMVAVPGDSDDAALEGAERVGRRLDDLVAAGKLGGYESPARFLPSKTGQPRP